MKYVIKIIHWGNDYRRRGMKKINNKNKSDNQDSIEENANMTSNSEGD